MAQYGGAFLPRHLGEGVSDDTPGALGQGRGERGLTVPFEQVSKDEGSVGCDGSPQGAR